MWNDDEGPRPDVDEPPQEPPADGRGVGELWVLTDASLYRIEGADGGARAARFGLDEDLSGCDVVFAVKEIPVELMRQGGAYVFFSHTIKGQSHNMPMLRRMMELGCTLFGGRVRCDQRFLQQAVEADAARHRQPAQPGGKHQLQQESYDPTHQDNLVKTFKKGTILERVLMEEDEEAPSILYPTLMGK